MFLNEFVRAGNEEYKVLINCGAINKCIQFYLLKRLKLQSNLNNMLNLNSFSINNDNYPPTTSSNALAANEDAQSSIQQLHLQQLSSGSEDETSDINPLQDQKLTFTRRSSPL